MVLVGFVRNLLQVPSQKQLDARFDNPQNVKMTALSLRRRFGTSGLISVRERLRLFGGDCELGKLQRDAERQWIIAGTESRAQSFYLPG